MSWTFQHFHICTFRHWRHVNIKPIKWKCMQSGRDKQFWFVTQYPDFVEAVKSWQAASADFYPQGLGQGCFLPDMHPPTPFICTIEDSLSISLSFTQIILAKLTKQVWVRTSSSSTAKIKQGAGHTPTLYHRLNVSLLWGLSCLLMPGLLNLSFISPLLLPTLCFLSCPFLLGEKKKEKCRISNTGLSWQNGWLNGEKTHPCAEAQILSPGTDHSREPQWRVFIWSLYFVWLKI